MEIILNLVQSMVLGVMEGLTEFLPISSTGHLIIVDEFLNIGSIFSKNFSDMFMIVIQLGAIFAVIAIYFKKIFPLGILNSHKLVSVRSLWTKIIIAVLPALVVGGLFGSVIKDYLFNYVIVAIMLFLGGIIILFVEKRSHKEVVNDLNQMSYKTALMIGLAQCLAVVPGISRAGATIVGGLLLGASRSVAVEFSFLLAVPTIAAASIYSLMTYEGVWSYDGVFYLLIGFAVSFVSAFLIIKMFLSYIKKHDLSFFGYYRIVLGLILILIAL